MKRATIHGCLLAIVLAAIASPAPAEEKKANEFLQAGLIKETIGGDLDAAIGLYQQALREAGGNTELTAKARLRLGAAYERQGNPQARQTLESIVWDYSSTDQRAVAAEAQTLLAALARPAGAAAPQAPGTLNLKVEISTIREGTRLATQSHVVPLSNDGRMAQVRSGSEVPLNLNGQTYLHQVGNQIDCLAKRGADGRYTVQITITQRAVEDEKASADALSFRNFIVATTLVLADGESASVSGVDIFNNETMQADVTLRVNQ